MISAFDVYVVMMADRVVDLFNGLTAISLIAALCFGFGAVVMHATDATEKGLAAMAYAKRALFLAAASCVGYALTPDTKTLAAMYVLPAITSEQVTEPVGKEAAELYQIAKGALKRLAEPEKAEQVEEAKP